MVIAEMGSGGAETIVADLSRHLMEGGREVTVASSGGWRAEALGELGARPVALPLRESGPGPIVRSTLRLRAELRSRPVDLVHAHNVRATTVAYLATRKWGSSPPLLATVHGLPDQDYALAARVLNRCADLVAAVSVDVGEQLLEGGLAPDRLRIVENSSQPLERMDRALARRELGIAADRPVALCVARLVDVKRHDRLLDAWAGQPGDPLLVLAGDGPLRRQIEDRVRAHGLSGRVQVLGDRRDVGRLLAASDLLVLSSDSEGLPMTVLEALSLGVPVVAPAIGGLTTLGDGAVELVQPGSAEALAAGLGAVLDNPERRRRMAVAAVELSRNRFSPTAMRSAYEILYKELLASRDQ